MPSEPGSPVRSEPVEGRTFGAIRPLLLAGAILGFTGVLLGAFGAHIVRDHVSADEYDRYRTAATYHLVHALAVFAAAFLYERRPDRSAIRAGWAFVIGVVFFSGSLYLLGIVGPSLLGAVAPIGGLAFLIGWALLAKTAWTST